MSEPFHGVLPALITPFTEDGEEIDDAALSATVERLIGAGVAGLVPGGSTGEFTTLTNAERRRLVEVPSRRPPAGSPSSPGRARSRRARPSS
jgi:dihydrodipicolinate synthase/N-acetylneuraminate lyase